MHRKHVRRWHKLLSVSGILVAIFGGLTIPMANAVTGDTTPLGIYGMSYYNGATQVQYIDFPGNVSGLETSDFYFTGTSTGCMLYPVPNITGFSFSVTVTNCSEGTFHLNLKANSVTDSHNITGPAVDFIGDINEINRQTPVAQFQNVPTSTNTDRIVFEVEVNHPLQNNGPYNIGVEGSGCVLDSSIRTTYGMQFTVASCNPGALAKITVNPMALKDVYGNLGPATALTSPTVSVAGVAPSASPTPTATTTSSPTASPSASPTTSPTPTATPTASPTASPTATASPIASPTLTSSPTATAVAAPPPPPAEPPAPPQEPVVVAEPTVAPPVVEAPAIDLPELAVVPVASISLAQSKIVAVRKVIAQQTQVAVVLPKVIPAQPAPAVMPVVESTEAGFNWQPIGYLAIGLGGVAALIGGYLLIQRMMRVRRFRFS